LTISLVLGSQSTSSISFPHGFMIMASSTQSSWTWTASHPLSTAMSPPRQIRRLPRSLRLLWSALLAQAQGFESTLPTPTSKLAPVVSLLLLGKPPNWKKLPRTSNSLMAMSWPRFSPAISPPQEVWRRSQKRLNRSSAASTSLYLTRDTPGPSRLRLQRVAVVVSEEFRHQHHRHVSRSALSHPVALAVWKRRQVILRRRITRC
jgi:hypothetical protein